MQTNHGVPGSEQKFQHLNTFKRMVRTQINSKEYMYSIVRSFEISLLRDEK